MGAQRGFGVFSSEFDFDVRFLRLQTLSRLVQRNARVQQAFGPASKSAIKCRIRSAVTQAEAAIAIATSLHW
jgi:hypothetical protein